MNKKTVTVFMGLLFIAIILLVIVTPKEQKRIEDELSKESPDTVKLEEKVVLEEEISEQKEIIPPHLSFNFDELNKPDTSLATNDGRGIQEESNPRLLKMDTGVRLFQDDYNNIIYYRSAPSGSGPFGGIYALKEEVDMQIHPWLCDYLESQTQEILPSDPYAAGEFCDDYIKYLISDKGFHPLNRIDPELQDFEVFAYDLGFDELWEIGLISNDGTEIYSELTSGQPEYLNIYATEQDNNTIFLVYGKSGPAWEGSSTGDQLAVISLPFSINKTTFYPPHKIHGRSQLMTGGLKLDQGEVRPHVITKDATTELNLVSYQNNDMGIRFMYPQAFGEVMIGTRSSNGYPECDNEPTLYFSNASKDFWISPYTDKCAQATSLDSKYGSPLTGFNEEQVAPDDYFQYYTQGIQYATKSSTPSTDPYNQEYGLIFNSKKAQYGSYLVKRAPNLIGRSVAATFETIE